jgi:protein gp37
MADVFDAHPTLPPHRERLWELIGRTPWLDWLLLTKRPENIARMVPWVTAPENVWLGTTTENQKCADERIPHLLANPAPVHFLSCEPLLSPLDVSPWLGADRVNWILCGGESGAKAHPMHPDWARGLRDQCGTAGVPFHFKQWGEWLPLACHREFMDLGPADRPWCKVGDLPGAMVRVGKKAAGRLLDGVLWDEMPERSHA